MQRYLFGGCCQQVITRSSRDVCRSGPLCGLTITGAAVDGYSVDGIGEGAATQTKKERKNKTPEARCTSIGDSLLIIIGPRKLPVL